MRLDNRLLRATGFVIAAALALAVLFGASVRAQESRRVPTQFHQPLEVMANQLADELSHLPIYADGAEPVRVLVIDFFRSDGLKSSALGSALADLISTILAAAPRRFQVVDRARLLGYLKQKHASVVNSLQTTDEALAVARELGATGIVVGELIDEGDKLKIQLWTDSLGRSRKLSAIVDLDDMSRKMLLEPGPSFADAQAKLLLSPGEITTTQVGFSPPRCKNCRTEEFSGRSAETGVRGEFELSVLIEADGTVRWAESPRNKPADVIAAACQLVRTWTFYPARNAHGAVEAKVQLKVKVAPI